MKEKYVSEHKIRTEAEKYENKNQLQTQCISLQLRQRTSNKTRKLCWSSADTLCGCPSRY